MKRLFNRHIYLGRLQNRTNDEFIDRVNEKVEAHQDSLRWFCGMNDMQSTFVCQAL